MRTAPSKHARRSHHDFDEPRLLSFVVGIAVGAMLIGVVWGGVWLFTSEEGSGPLGGAERSAALSRAAGAASSEDPGSAPAKDACREVLELQGAAVRAGAAPLSQWKVHIGAMNQLVAGAISLEQARNFWDDTRVGAQRKLAGFRSAQRELESREDRCPGATPPGDGEHTEGSCAAAVAARAPALRALDTALSTWREHVHHMEMLRMGHMSPEQAGQLWLASWHTGVEQVRSYHRAARESRHAHC